MLSSPLRTAILALACATAAPAGFGQAGSGVPAAAASSSRVLGTVAAVGNGTVTIHPASGADVVVTLSPETRLLRAAPGAKSLKDAVPMTASELAAGDRVLVRLSSDSDAAHPSAAMLVAMKGTDLAHAHAEEAAAWQQHGVSGIVDTVDPATGTITLRPAGRQAAMLKVHTTASTAVRRYASTSTAFADARPSSLADIKPGDQLRARGARTGDDIAADEIVAGSFRNIAGTVTNADPATGTLSLIEPATKKTVTLHLDAQTQLRKLPQGLAERLAHSNGGGGGAHARPGGGNEDLEALLQRTPALQLGELKKGDAVMVVASGPGAPQPTAITVIAGVEPLLGASSQASNELFSASWNISGGGEDASASEGGGPQR